MTSGIHDTPEISEAWNAIVQSIRDHSPTELTKIEAEEAAMNVVAFFRLALEIRKEMMENKKHDNP